MVLARILSADSSLTAIVGSWKDIADFQEEYGDLDSRTSFSAELDVNPYSNAGLIVRLSPMENAAVARADLVSGAGALPPTST
ncbi:hypothetical protein AURDEDRAFT_143014 [Auricularia subglabra TFB-10046 SS5]|nr:hypothetical protein AURDEDRAFT_143014 [Auricularia subglabra TFB-10046 SS5]